MYFFVFFKRKDIFVYIFKLGVIVNRRYNNRTADNPTTEGKYKLNKMRTVLKIILTIVAFLVFFFLVLIIKGVQGQTSRSSGVGGPVGIILMVGFLAGVRAIWNYNPDKNKNDKDNHELDKK